MKLNKKNKIIVSAIALIALVAILICAFNSKDIEHSKYSKFREYVENSQVDSISMNTDQIYFDIEDKSYYTENPRSENFREFLLLNDVIINEEVDPMEAFYTVFEIFTVVLFCFAVGTMASRVTGHGLFKVIKNKDVNFNNIVGMKDLKKDALELIDIMKNKEKYDKLGIRQPKGILLEGDPGNGKTLFAKALAGEAKMNFIAARATDFESAIMAIGPMKIKSLFKLARRKAPCIIFIDEFDGIGTRRNYSGNAVETENTRIVTALLNELDGFKSQDGILVVVATNNAKVLDEALTRPGRFDRKYLIKNPSKEDRLELFKYYTRNLKLDSDVNLEKIADRLNGVSAARIETIVNEANIIAHRENSDEIKISYIDEGIKITENKI